MARPQRTRAPTGTDAVHRWSRDRADLRAIEWAINEITANVINHSRSPVGGFVQVTNFPGVSRRVEFAVCDAGIGIPETLRATHPNLPTDQEALDRAIREGVTRDKDIGQGNGLKPTVHANVRFSPNYFRSSSSSGRGGGRTRESVVNPTRTLAPAPDNRWEARGLPSNGASSAHHRDGRPWTVFDEAFAAGCELSPLRVW